MRIFKYPLEDLLLTGFAEIEVPRGYKVLDVQPQYHADVQQPEIMLWAAVEEDNPKVRIRVDLKPTGGSVELNDLQYYLKTIQTLGGALIWHIFVRPV